MFTRNKVLDVHSLHTFLIPLFTVSSDFSASQADPESYLTGAIVGVMLSVFVVVVALVMGVICFGVFWSRRSAKSRLKHHGYTNAVFSRESGTVCIDELQLPAYL